MEHELEGVYSPQQFYDDAGLDDYKVYTGNVQERTAILNRLADAIDEELDKQEPSLWRTKDGRYIDPHNMTTSHIKNTLAMLKYHGFVGPSTVSFYLSGPMPHGEMAMDAYEQEFDHVLDAPVSKFVDVFEAILKEREDAL